MKTPTSTIEHLIIETGFYIEIKILCYLVKN
jgi:hypothetical protein